MVSMTALHSLTAEFHGGMLTLAFACIMAVAVSQLIVGYKKRFPEGIVDLALKVRGYAEATGYVAAVGGLIGLFLSYYADLAAGGTIVLVAVAAFFASLALTRRAT